MKMVEELIVHAVLFVLMLVLYTETKTFPVMNIGGSLGSAWWPQLVLGLGMLMTLTSAGFVVFKNLRERGGKTKVTAAELMSLGTSAGIFLVFLLAIEVVGFLGAAPLLVFGFMYQLGARKLPSLVLIPILSSPLFAVIFGRFMEVPLPRGVGVARIFSFYLF